MIGLHLAGQSWLHRISAGLKLLVLAVVSVALLPLYNLPVLCSILILILLLYASLGRAAVRSLKLLRPLLPILLLLLAFQAWSLGWAAGLVLLGRMVALILLANLVTLTTTMEAMMAALMPLLSPLRLLGVAPERIAFAVALLIRFVPVLMALLGHLLETWRARGGGRHKWRLAVPMLIGAIRLADHVAEAVAARGGIRTGTADSQHKEGTTTVKTRHAGATSSLPHPAAGLDGLETDRKREDRQ